MNNTKIYNNIIIHKKYGDLLVCNRITNSHRKYFNVYPIGMNCNYDCSYCFRKTNNLRSLSTKYLSKISDIKQRNTIKKLFRIPERDTYYTFDYNRIYKFVSILNENLDNDDRKLYVDINGGEPTLYNKLINLIEDMYNLNIEVNLQTNGSQSPEYYEKIIRLFPQIEIQISFHSEFADIEHFKELQNMFLSNNFKRYHFKILIFDDFYYEKINNFFNIVKDKKQNLEITFNRYDTTIEYLLNNKYKEMIESEDYWTRYYRLKFEDNTEMVLNEQTMFILGYAGIFLGMKCNTLKRNLFHIINDNIKVIDRKNDVYFKLDEYSKYFEYYNKDYVICDKDKCTTNCFLSADKWR